MRSKAVQSSCLTSIWSTAWKASCQNKPESIGGLVVATGMDIRGESG
jgi:hypothetical protein